MNDITGDFSPQDMDISDISDKNPPTGLGGKLGVLGLPNGVVKAYFPSGPDNPRHGISIPLNGRNCGCKK